MGERNRNIPRHGVNIDALRDWHGISAQCQTCMHTAPVPLATIKARRHLAPNGLLQELHGYLRCTRCQAQVNNVLIFSNPAGMPAPKR